MGGKIWECVTHEKKTGRSKKMNDDKHGSTIFYSLLLFFCSLPFNDLPTMPCKKIEKTPLEKMDSF